MKRLNDSFPVDYRLLDADVQGSIAWAHALEQAGVLTEAEAAKIVKGLRAIAKKGTENLPLDDHEDVHSYVESALGEIVGPLAKKLHTGRSRNDQVATDLRLWLREAVNDAIEPVLDLTEALARKAEEEHDSIMPGYTHLKQAEPVTFGHWCLAYVEMLLRDVDRFESALERGDECPLGSGAVAGTPIDIDRESLARELGFSRPTGNSLDSVASRDFEADALFACSMLLSHLSRMAADLIFFSADETAYVEFPDALATGSSRMPQKKNPDLLELVRAHAARSAGELSGFLTLMHGLPLAYNKDLQLDKEPLFRSFELLESLLPALGRLVIGLTIDRERMKAAASSDLLLSTAVMDSMASRDVPFREAHEIVSRRIGEAIRKGVTLAELGPDGKITKEDLRELDATRAVARKAATGGTSPKRVRKAAATALKRIEKARAKQNRESGR
ncbi:MAG: argininosuccinate lyase [Acidobacteria bacterium]|nr:argininosuccinate lyase [Acidobacteriota bacterium]